MVSETSQPRAEETGHDESGQSYADMASLVTPDRVRLHEDDFHVLHLFVDGAEHTDVRAFRAFPISGKGDFIGFMDHRGKEVALLTNPRGLDHDSRKTLDHALSRLYYIPTITRVDSITEMHGVSEWKVQTDSGYASFEVVEREKIRKLPNGRLVIQDADGNRYEIQDVMRLDRRSQDLIFSET